MYSSISPEDKIIRALEIKQESDLLLNLFKVRMKENSEKKLYLIFQECETDPDSKKGDAAEMFSKCKSGLADYTTNVKTMDPMKFANDMIAESEFYNGEF